MCTRGVYSGGERGRPGCFWWLFYPRVMADKKGRFINVKTPIAPHLPASNLTLPAKRLIPNVKGQGVMDGWTCRGMSYCPFSFIANDSNVFLG